MREAEPRRLAARWTGARESAVAGPSDNAEHRWDAHLGPLIAVADCQGIVRVELMIHFYIEVSCVLCLLHRVRVIACLTAQYRGRQEAQDFRRDRADEVRWNRFTR